MPAKSPSSPSRDLLEDFRRRAVDEGMVSRGDRILVGLSGGIDSMALLDLLDRLRGELELHLAAAHLDHRLREQSEEDRHFCAEFCASRRIEFHETIEDVAALASQTGLGSEGAGRLARYRWLEEIRSTGGFDRIALGHQRDDHLETLLMWLFRGTGLQGMAGIQAGRGAIIRPLRHFPRERIEAHVRERGLPFREDASNADPSFLRNRIRAELIPRIREIFGEEALSQLEAFAGRASNDHQALQTLAGELLDRCRAGEDPEGVWLDRKRFLEAPRALRYRVVRRVTDDFLDPARPQRWNQEAYERVLDFTEQARAGKRCPLPGGGWLEVERERLFWRPPPREEAGDPDNDPEGAWTLSEELLPPDASGIRFCLDHQACFDADSIEPPLRLRHFQAGDRMNPLGMKGRKRLVELFREHGISHSRRSRRLVVEDAREIIWAVGITTAAKCRIHPDTRSVLRLRLEKA